MSTQGSDAWRLDRVGKVTASRIADLLATTKSGWGASRTTYANELFAERMTGLPIDRRFETPEMRWGRETESQARAVYVFERDVEVKEVGFVPHPRIANAGASPDGLIGDDATGGVLEIKCLSTAHHLELLESRSIPARYRQQMYWQGACTGRRWGHFVCFDPRLEEPLQLFVQRIDFEAESIASMEKEVVTFLAEIDERVERLRRLRRADVAA
jgi:hypothetical protein